MRPEVIRFTGLDLTPEQALFPRKRTTGIYPAEWVRHQWIAPVDYASSAPANFAQLQVASIGPSPNLRGLARLDRYIERTLLGQWGSYCVSTPDGLKYVVLFEQVPDAVMFRLRGGERAFLRSEEEWL
jgi:hypothetical protein